MALSRDLVIRLQGDADSAIKAQRAAADAAGVNVAAYRKAEREYARQQKAMETASRKQREAMESTGRVATVAGAAIVAGIGLATRAAVEWESAWTGVLKTVNGTPEQLAAIEEGLRGLARTLPATHTEIAAVAEAAGQLGVEADSIVEFTKVMVDLGETTNLSADEAATSIAQMMNVMQTAPDDVDRMGATLVALGNAGASTERDIIQMSQRIAGAAAVVGLSEDEVLAFSNTVASMGIEVEAGGSSVSRVLTDMSKAAQMGGEDLEVFAETAGVSADEFARAFSEDPAEAFAMFIEGLGGIVEEGGNAFEVLDDLGLSDVRVSQALLGMASSGDLLRESLNLGSEAWEENTALVEEAAKRYDTTAAKTEIARNALNDAAIEIGDAFLPVLASLAEGVADVAQWFADLPDPIKNTLGGLAGVAGVASLAGGAFLLLAPRIMDTWKSFQALKESSPGVATGLGKVGKAAGIAGIVIALKSAIDGLVESTGKAAPTMEETTEALLGVGESMDGVNAMFQTNGADVFTDGINGLADAARNLADPSLIDRLDDFGAELLFWEGNNGRQEREMIIDQIGQMGQSLGMMVQSGNAELAAEQFDHLAAEWERGGGNVEELRELMPAYEEALAGVANEQSAAAESATLQAQNARLLAADLDFAYASLGNYAAALGLSEEETADLIEASNLLGESLGTFIDPLGTYTGLLQEKAQAEADAANKVAETTGAQTTSWQDYVDDVDVTLDEYLTRLQQQVADQEAWQTNMLLLAGRVSQGTLDELARMGPEGARLVADLVTASDEELQVFDDVTARRSKEAMDAWGAQLTLAQPVLAEIARRGGKGAADAAAAELAAGTRTLGQIAGDWGIVIAGGLNPILASLGKPRIVGVGPNRATYYDGGYTGPGGKYDPAGIVHAGEYVLTKEQTSRLGIDRIEQFANNGYAGGGFVSTDAVPRPPSTAPFQHPLSTVAGGAMDKVYGDTVDWIKANLVPALGPGIGYQAMFAAVQKVFPYVQLHSGFRPGSITATGNLSYHASGRAIDITPDMAIFNWIAQNYGTQARELIFSPANGRQIWNGRPHMYSEPTRGDHWDHIHFAMANGGVINEPVVGRGLRTGASYAFGERGPETVLPGTRVGAGGGGSISVSVPAPMVRIYLDGQEWRGMARIEAEEVATEALSLATSRGRYNG